MVRHIPFWVADGIARHILWISNRGARCVTIAILIINDLELIAQNPLQDRKTEKLYRRSDLFERPP